RGQADPAESHRDDLGPRSLVRLLHDVDRRVLSRSDDQSRREFLAPDDQIRVAHGSTSPALSAAHRSDDLDPVAVAKHGGLVGALRRHLAVHRHRGVLALDAEVRQEPVHAQAVGDFQVLSVDADLHKQNGRVPSTGAAALSLTPCSLRWNYPVQVRGVPGRTRFSGNLPPRRQGGVYHRGVKPARAAQASVSWRPGLAITRGSAPSTQLAPGGTTTDAERT